MTGMSAAKMVLLGLVLITLAGAETVWSFALSDIIETASLRPSQGLSSHPE